MLPSASTSCFWTTSWDSPACRRRSSSLSFARRAWELSIFSLMPSSGVLGMGRGAPPATGPASLRCDRNYTMFGGARQRGADGASRGHAAGSPRTLTGPAVPEMHWGKPPTRSPPGPPRPVPGQRAGVQPVERRRVDVVPGSHGAHHPPAEAGLEAVDPGQAGLGAARRARPPPASSPPLPTSSGMPHRSYSVQPWALAHCMASHCSRWLGIRLRCSSPEAPYM